MIATFNRLLTGALLTLLLTACGSSGDVEVRYYLVTPVDDPGINYSSDTAVEIMDLEIPQYLERFQIASRRSNNQLAFSNAHQWAENLRKNLSRTLARNLSIYLMTSDVGTPRNRSLSTPDVRVKVYLEQFERGADGYVTLVARWQLVDGGGKTLLTRSDRFVSTNTVPAPDYAGTVAAMGGLFAELSSAIAAAIREQVDES